jgi:DNA-binding NarL/FixJ family response regulator
VEAHQAERTRVVLVDMSNLLRGIVREVLVPEPDVVLVGEFPDATGLLEAVDETAADVVVVGGRLGAGAPVRDLLAARPRVRVLAIADDGRRGTVFLLTPERESLGEVSPGVLLDAIRDAPDWSGFAEADR